MTPASEAKAKNLPYLLPLLSLSLSLYEYTPDLSGLGIKLLRFGLPERSVGKNS